MELKYFLFLNLTISVWSLLIVLNGIEMIMDSEDIITIPAFNRTKWN